MRISILGLLAALSAPLYGQAPVQLRVDATDAPRRLFHVQITMPAKSGPLTLLYPEWIPGEHGPTGPVVNLVGLKVQGGGKSIAWKRDSVNMYAFHLDVPAGVSSLDIAFDFISPPEAGGFTSGASATSELAVLNWNQVLLYPQGTQADDLQYQATLRGPQWLAVWNRAAHRQGIRQPDRIPAGLAHHAGGFAGVGRSALPHHRSGDRKRHPALSAPGGRQRPRPGSEPRDRRRV
jgi:hypothetical protein